MPFCVFAGYSVLTHANDSLTYLLLDRMKTIIGKEMHYCYAEEVKKFPMNSSEFSKPIAIQHISSSRHAKPLIYEAKENNTKTPESAIFCKNAHKFF